jgi:small subunit ribosomal protein S15
VGCQARKGTYNTDFSGTLEYKRHDQDVGSSEYQIARLTTRITQLTAHLKEHKKDHATRRGLMAMLNRRNTLLQYLFKNDRPTYTATIQNLGIRSRLTDKL